MPMEDGRNEETMKKEEKWKTHHVNEAIGRRYCRDILLTRLSFDFNLL